MAVAPWIVSDELWQLVEPLLPVRERRFRYPGQKRLPDREALQGILFVLHTGISWTHLPPELGFGSGVTCWRRLDEWQKAGVWEGLAHRSGRTTSPVTISPCTCSGELRVRGWASDVVAGAAVLLGDRAER